MTKTERKFIRILTGCFYGLTVFILIGLMAWFYPRKVVKFATPMVTDKLEYSIGERVTVSGETWTNVDAPMDFDVRLICNDTKWPYQQIKDFAVGKQVKPVPYKFPYDKLPDYIPRGTSCRIETTGTYPVQILPLMTRNYQYKFSSNQFDIKE